MNRRYLVDCYITSWDSPKVRAEKNADLLRDHYYLETVGHNKPFGDQWLEAVEHFRKHSGHIMMWLMGDVTPPLSMEALTDSMFNAFASDAVAMYAPNINWTSQLYNIKNPITAGLMHQPWHNVFEVCGTDLLMCAMSRDLIEEAPSIEGNPRGWFYDYVLTATANSRLGKKVVRDYNFTALHPQGSEYDMTGAFEMAQRWMDKLPKDILRATQDLINRQRILSI